MSSDHNPSMIMLASRPVFRLRPRFLLQPLTSVLAVCGLALSAQPLPATQAPSSAPEETVVLSPFVVNSSKDVGYVATNTLAGSRLNTPLADTPASISVFTPEFLADIDASDMMKAIDYSVNFQENRTNAGGNPQQENDINVQARGLGGGGGFRQASRNYFTWFLNSDSYNTESLTFSRGPNSILFGLGDPGGIVNTSTLQPKFTNRSKAVFRFDENGSVRVSVDVDMRISDKIGLRFAGLAENGKTWRELAYKDQLRAYLAGAWRLTPKTTLRFDGEYADVKQLRSLPFTARDRFGGWVTAGKPLYDRSTMGTAAANYPTGVSRISANSTSPRISIDADRPGEVTNWQNLGVGNANAGSTNLGNYPLTDFNFVPKTIDLRGPAATTNNPQYSYAGYVEQEIVENLFLEVAANVQWERRDWRNPVQEGRAGIFADPNVVRPDNTPNPKVGTYYVEDIAIERIRSRDIKNLRATLAYEHNFDSWLGRHRFVGLASREQLDTLTTDYIEANTTPLNPLITDLTNPVNHISRRTYLNFQGGNRNYKDDPWSDNRVYVMNDPINGVSGTVTPDFVKTAIQPTKTVDTSYLIGGQSYFLKDRLAVTYGYRQDEVSQNSFVNTRDPITNVVATGVLGPKVTAKGTTKTLGGVVKVWKGLSLAYNQSDTFQPQTTLDLNRQNMGNIKGKGFDVGARFAALQGRVYATATYYESESQNRSDFTALNNVQDINLIWTAIEGSASSRIIDQIGTQDTRDETAQGWEYEVVGNITDSWSIRANYATPRATISNINPRTRAYIEANRAIWTSAANVNLPIANQTTNNTVGTRLSGAIDPRLATEAANEGRTGRGVRDEQFTLFTNYKFRQGALKGFSAGIGERGYGNNVLVYIASTGLPVYGRGYWITDLKLGYEKTHRTFGKKVDYKLQLNVANLLDENNVIFNQASSSVLGRPDIYYFIDPRTVSASLSLTF
jgi:iron complex outermembrane receptor protein